MSVPLVAILMQASLGPVVIADARHLSPRQEDMKPSVEIFAIAPLDGSFVITQREIVQNSQQRQPFRLGAAVHLDFQFLSLGSAQIRKERSDED